MRMNICSCLLALVLGCNVTAEIIHQIVEEKEHVSLRCSHSVEGKLTWSREINGNTVDILIVDGDGEQRFNDPHKRYGSAVDKSLHIRRTNVSDSGKYLCNNEAAVELTVIPSGTTIVSIAEKSNVTLTCPDVVGGSHVPTWTREIDGKQQQIRRHVSAVDKYLNIPDVQPGDSGLYYCDGKPAANLNVTKGDQSERDDNTGPTSPTATSITSPSSKNTEANRTSPSTTPTTTTATITVPAPPKTTTEGEKHKKKTSPTTTSTTSQPATNTDDDEESPSDENKEDDEGSTSPTTTSTTSQPAANTGPTSPTTTSTISPPAKNTDQKPILIWVVGIVVSFLLVLIIITVYCAWRCKRRGTEEIHHIYDGIQDEGLNPTKRVESSGGPSAEYCLVTFPGGSKQNEPTCCTIPDPPPTGNKTDASLTDSPYSMITKPLPDGKTGTPQLNDPTYSLLEKPKVLENNDQYLHSFK
ncbi:integumentary mucin C.1-like isoform X2 [Thunnus maccoyii]|uniref:integumentary mucin C.1-like isoform X2 n=1 Tax=Thunnus maccoyii TaxID=8240 RepID=UPI001C4D9CA2|nr:integumentary mucin C.1-like isoform X2 [Thunnus maccoyii]